jgi:hypothetical protein
MEDEYGRAAAGLDVLRTLKKSPAFVTISVLTLSLG